MPVETKPWSAHLERLRGKLVVSCQAHGDNPLRGPEFMAAMAEAAVRGGAAGIRADGVDDVAAIRRRVDVPILGINKLADDSGKIFITPTAASATAIIAAGAELIALDGTPRPRPNGETLSDVVAAIHASGAASLADIDTIEHARFAIEGGVDLVGTTLSGYTDASPKQSAPDFALLRQLVAESPVPVFAEGRIWTPEQAREALAIGAAFVVIGTAITNPMAITVRFTAAMFDSQNH